MKSSLKSLKNKINNDKAQAEKDQKVSAVVSKAKEDIKKVQKQIKALTKK